jgi:hypothetical protein
MKSFFNRYWYVIGLAVLGLAGGFVYWRFIGCSSGSCPITSNWHTSTAMGGLMGFLTGSLVQDISGKKPPEK